jgi:hypothetical protein
MRRLPRILLNAATVVSLVLCTCTILSGCTGDRPRGLELSHPDPWLYLLVDRRSVRLLRVDPALWPITWNSYRGHMARVSEVPTFVDGYRDISFTIEGVGFFDFDYSFTRPRKGPAGRPAPWRWEMSAPLVPTIILLLLLPAYRIARWLQRSQNVKHGRCPTCGYDLRATHDRCPECGTRPTPATPLV